MDSLTPIRPWLHYFFIVFPGAGRVGDPSQAQAIAVQAYGRNTYPDDALQEVTSRYYQLDENDNRTIAYLKQEGFKPGNDNRRIARRCMRLVDAYNIPWVIAQWEVVCAMAFDEPEWFAAHQRQIITLWPPDQYFNTYLVKSVTVEHMKELGITRVIELAQPWHVARAALIFRRLLDDWIPGLWPIIVTERRLRQLEGKKDLPPWFDWRSVQVWTKHFLIWCAYEAGARYIHHPQRRWI